MSNLLKTNTLCPFCLPGAKNVLANRPGTFETFCVNGAGAPGGHKWQDTEELNAAIAQAKRAYPDAYKAPPKPAEDPSLRSRDIVIDPETRAAIEELIKQPLNSASEIKGILFDAVKSSEATEAELRRLRATSAQMKRAAEGKGGSAALGPNQMIVTIPEWAESAIDSYAEHEGKTKEEWINEQLTGYLESYCSSPA